MGFIPFCFSKIFLDWPMMVDDGMNENENKSEGWIFLENEELEWNDQWNKKILVLMN